MITYFTSVRREQAYNFFLEKVLSYKNKIGHFTDTGILSKRHYFLHILGKIILIYSMKLQMHLTIQLWTVTKAINGRYFFSLCSLNTCNATIFLKWDTESI